MPKGLRWHLRPSSRRALFLALGTANLRFAHFALSLPPSPSLSIRKKMFISYWGIGLYPLAQQ